MYRTIVLDCQTKSSDVYCEDCIVKEICKVYAENQKQNKKESLETGLALEIVA